MQRNSVNNILLKDRYARNSGVTICGCASKLAPGMRIPPSNTPRECLATSGATPPSMRKRAQILSKNIGTLQFTCHVEDYTLHPFQNCLNFIGAFCNSTYINESQTLKATRISDCRTVVDTLVSGMNSNWKNVRTKCGQWSSSKFTKGDNLGNDCKNANLNLQGNGFYRSMTEGSLWPVTAELTDSVMQSLWNNDLLKN